MTGDYLVCPECRGQNPLQTLREQLHCPTCNRTFPNVGGIPVLMPDAPERLSRWSAQLAAFQAETEEAVRQVLAQSVTQGLLPRSRARLVSVADGLRAHAAWVHELFAGAGVSAKSEQTDATTGESIVSYSTLVHRDWGWAPEVDEVSPALDALTAVLPAGFRLGRTLVLGAGTGRLAWDLGNRVEGASEIVALDINPLPFLVTKLLMRGAAVSMYELPGHPRRSTFASTERKLRAHNPPPAGFELLFADGLNPPVKDGAFDTVLTPWFVDQVPADLATLPPMIRRVLRPGGTWLNQGPFVYDPARTKPAHRYCADEFIQIVSGSGFAITKATYLPQGHMASPVSAQGRSEWVLTMHATAAAADLQTTTEPLWLTTSGQDLPIPVLPGMKDYDATHSSVALVVSLIDGTNSAHTIATKLVSSAALSPNGAIEAVQACLRVFWNDLSKR